MEVGRSDCHPLLTAVATCAVQRLAHEIRQQCFPMASSLFLFTNHHHTFDAPSATNMTSLTPQEARVVHKLNLFASVCPQCLFVEDSHKLIRQLYRFNYFYPSKKKRVKFPEDWDWNYGEPNGSLQTTARKVQEWFTRPDALKAPAPEEPPRPSSPTPAPQLQSPLYSVLPVEIREYIFKLVVTSYPEDDYNDYHYPATTPAITSVSRLVRRELLQSFLKHNHFAFPTSFDSTTIDNPLKWLYGMRPHLPKIHQITFFVNHWARDSSSMGDISVTIRHDPTRDCWKTTCEDDWSVDKAEWRKREPEDRKALERDGNLLCGLMRTMVEGRSRDYLTTEYLMWLMYDARMLYTAEKMEGTINPDYVYPAINAMGPSIMRLPDMYSTNIEHDQMVRWGRR
jgi:hypothetical protein